MAAAAGAGYLANFWKSALKKDGDSVSKQVGLDSPDENAELIRSFNQRAGHKRGENGCLLYQRSIQKQEESLFSGTGEWLSDASHTDNLLQQRDGGKRICGIRPMSSEEFVRDDSSLLSLQPWIFKKNCREDGESMTQIRECPDSYDHVAGYNRNTLQSHLSPKCVDTVHGFRRNKNSLRSRKVHKYSLKPLSSTENCLIPQLYKDDIDFEEYVFSPFPSPSSHPTRPFLVTNDKQIISKSRLKPFNEGFDGGLHQQLDSTVDEVVAGIRPLQASWRKTKRKCEIAECGKQDTGDPKHTSLIFQFPELVERVLFFCMGLNIGVLSSALSSKKEVEKLNDMLKHSNSLVQDLQEELEMNNSLVVKELVNEACVDEQHQNNVSDFVAQVYAPLKHDLNFSSPKQQENKSNSQNLSRSDGKKESLSIIEAELEAELERLEINMNALSLKGRISALAELDPGLVGEVIHGELKEEYIPSREKQDGDCSDCSTNVSSSTPRFANHSVSPRELSLRLHEVIQSQLQKRIQELETQLYNSKRQLQLMEAEKVSSQAGFSNSDLGTSSNRESPMLMDEGLEIEPPLCLNLSGNALDAYNEAFEVFLGIAKTEEENPPSTTNMSGQIDRDELCFSDRSLPCDDGASMANETSNSEIFSGTWEHMDGGPLSNEVYDENTMEDVEADDEEGRMLIQQIIERTRQGSPLVINAQKILSLWTE